MGNATVYKQDEKMLYFSVRSDAERWFHDTEAKKYPKDFNIKQIVVNDYNHDKTQLFVEVVRCKDCKDHDSWSHTCVHWTHHCTPPGYSYKVNEDDYCAWGERRTR